MDNLYDVLIGEAPTDADKAAATAAALRRRRAFGELGVLSGDRVLSMVVVLLLRLMITRIVSSKLDSRI
jgi:hypothetical protein